jgi:endoglucanase
MDATKLPRWRGFNLLEKFTDRMNAPFVESDFEWLAEWGFDFVRLPLSYWCWAKPDPAQWLQMDESVLAEIDQCVEFGRQYGIHVNINFHRGPGYCVNPPAEPLDLWTSEEALEACASHWARFAERYKGIPNERVTFDLLNEPGAIAEDVYVHVCERLVGAIREQDPDRLIIADGMLWGNQPVHGLVGLGIAQSTRGYQPMQISHYKASWVRSEGWAEPAWPLDLNGDLWDRERLRRQQIESWQALEAKGVGVHVGEWGAFSHTPHHVVLAWMRDQLELWEEAGWGWAMWNFRGAFGILDSGREDVKYEDFRGHLLDREMLELVRRY